MLGRERVNPYTRELYCPYNDQTFIMSSVRDFTDDSKELIYLFQVYFSPLFRQRLNEEPPTKLQICLEVHLTLGFDENDCIRYKSVDVRLCPECRIYPGYLIEFLEDCICRAEWASLVIVASLTLPSEQLR